MLVVLPYCPHRHRRIYICSCWLFSLLLWLHTLHLERRLCMPLKEILQLQVQHPKMLCPGRQHTHFRSVSSNVTCPCIFIVRVPIWDPIYKTIFVCLKRCLSEKHCWEKKIIGGILDPDLWQHLLTVLSATHFIFAFCQNPSILNEDVRPCVLFSTSAASHIWGV